MSCGQIREAREGDEVKNARSSQGCVQTALDNSSHVRRGPGNRLKHGHLPRCFQYESLRIGGCLGVRAEGGSSGRERFGECLQQEMERQQRPLSDRKLRHRTLNLSGDTIPVMAEYPDTSLSELVKKWRTPTV